MRHVAWLRPTITRLLLSGVVFIVMPSFFYSRSISVCHVVQDVSYCGLQFRPLLSGLGTLESLLDHLRFLGMYPFTFGTLLLSFLFVALNLILAYVIACAFVHLHHKAILVRSSRR